MKLSTSLKQITEGWVAVNEQNEVVECELSFAEICRKVQKTRKKLVLIPAAKKYSGVFVTRQVPPELNPQVVFL